MTIFDRASLERTLSEMSIPEGHYNAIVGTVDQYGVALIVTLQREEIGATWQLQGVVRHDWTTHEAGAEARLLVSW